MCSLPIADTSVVYQLQAQGINIADDAVALFEDHSRGKMDVFQITILDTLRKKQVKTGMFKRMSDMAYPVMIQKFAIWASDDGDHDVYADGIPEVQDFLRIAEWPVLRACLRLWERHPSRAPWVHQAVQEHPGH